MGDAMDVDEGPSQGQLRHRKVKDSSSSSRLGSVKMDSLKIWRRKGVGSSSKPNEPRSNGSAVTSDDPRKSGSGTRDSQDRKLQTKALQQAQLSPASPQRPAPFQQPMFFPENSPQHMHHPMWGLGYYSSPGGYPSYAFPSYAHSPTRPLLPPSPAKHSFEGAESSESAGQRHHSSSDSNHQAGSINIYLPYVVTGYLQLLFNMGVMAVLCYLVYTALDSVQKDIDRKVDEFSTDVLNEINMCSRQYRENRCDSDMIPAMMRTCATWEACMKRDPRQVGRAKISAHTIGEIINSFVEPISYKTMLFSALLLFTFIAVSNLAFHFTKHTLLPHTQPCDHRSDKQPQRQWSQPINRTIEY